MSATPPAITSVSGEIYPGSIDPMLAAIRASLVDAGPAGSALDEFGERQVVIVAPDETDQGITAAIAASMAMKKGLCLLLIAGGAKNPDTDAPGPMMNLELEMQLYVSSRIRGKAARPVLELVAAIAKFFHHAEIRVSGFPWYERMKCLGFEPMQDPEFTAYVITFEREFQL